MTEWISEGSLLSFPYGWQEPAKTELWVYETLKYKNPYSQFVEFICFPWATLIDLIDRKQNKKAEFYINALKKIPPKKTLIRATACQHIKPAIVLNYLEKISVTDLYWSHTSSESVLNTRIRTHGLPLYPVAFLNTKLDKFKDLKNRKYLYSFVGAYDPGGYISDIREKIFNLPTNNNSVILKRDSWHFESQVYKEGILGEKLNETELSKTISEMDEYSSVLSETVYSLCPSGSGPNTIRFWESLAFGCIPVLLSDSWQRPNFLEKRMYVDLKERNLGKFILDLNEKNNVPSIGPSRVKIDVNDWLVDITNDLFDIEKIQQLIK